MSDPFNRYPSNGDGMSRTDWMIQDRESNNGCGCGCRPPCPPCPPHCPAGPTGPTGATAPSIYAQHGNCRNHAAFHYLKDN